MSKLPVSFPSLVISDNSTPTLQRAFQDLTRSLQLIAGANNNPDGGTTAARPTAQLVVGQRYFDTTLGKPIWWHGSAWVDATGATV